jgi:SAM-dependent methyltransferase
MIGNRGCVSKGDAEGITLKTYCETAESYADKRDRNPLFWEDQCLQFMGLLRGGGRILEVGCGPGVEARYFIERGYEVTGIDASEEMLEQARLRVPCGDFARMDMRRLDFVTRAFSGVWCCASLLHIRKEEAPSVVKEFRRVIRDDGALFVSLKKGNGEEMVRSPDGRERFFAFYQGEEAKGLVSSCGFAVMDSYEFERFGETWICVFAAPGPSAVSATWGEQVCQDLSKRGTTPIAACAHTPSSKAGTALL